MFFGLSDTHFATVSNRQMLQVKKFWDHQPYETLRPIDGAIFALHFGQNVGQTCAA